jgi:hypothetical protein
MYEQTVNTETHYMPENCTRLFGIQTNSRPLGQEEIGVVPAADLASSLKNIEVRLIL